MEYGIHAQTVIIIVAIMLPLVVLIVMNIISHPWMVNTGVK